jgi:hypothetical protein
MLGDHGLHSSMVWFISSLHSSIGSSVSSRISFDSATLLMQRCNSVPDMVNAKFSSISVSMSVATCDVAALRVTLNEVLDLVGKKHTITNTSGSYVGYSFFKQYAVALLLLGNIELLDNPDSAVPQHELAFQVHPPLLPLSLAPSLTLSRSHRHRPLP